MFPGFSFARRLGPLNPNATARRAPDSANQLGWLSLQSLPFPFFDGTIHANPFALQFFATADVSGSWSLATTWPAGVPSGTDFWIQFLVEDNTLLGGIGLSNAIKGTTF